VGRDRRHRAARRAAAGPVRGAGPASLRAGVLTDIREGDVGAILGWGFAPWSGGPFSWLDRIGAAEALATAEALAAAHGARFAPPDLLREMAAAGDSFTARFLPAAA
jgi:3-hydroxyacyl-CoA dehydrogenase/enoyl-CoA hydratase/3-hydroxybutyryl-CoA epimerase